MPEHQPQLVGWLAQYEAAIQDLIKRDSRIESLWREYSALRKDLEIQGAATTAETAALLEVLRRRRIAIEEQIVTAIEGYTPV
jgi:uncharacterized protein YdcH (DUF465 family)